MNEGYFVFHPKKDFGMRIENKEVHNLGISLDRIIDGTPNWKSLKDVISKSDL